MAAQLVAPRARDENVLVLVLPLELGALEARRHRVETLAQRFEVGHDDAGHAAQHLGLTRRQVELLHADVRPHVVDADHEIGVAGEPHAHDPEDRGFDGIGDGDVDVLEVNDVSGDLGGAVELDDGHG